MRPDPWDKIKVATFAIPQAQPAENANYFQISLRT
jgi:hypothetical protein